MPSETRRRRGLGCGITWILCALAACAPKPPDRPQPSPSGAPSTHASPGATSGPADAANFSAEARLLYRVVACAGSDPLPSSFPPAVVDKHCRWMKPLMARYREQYGNVAKPFLSGLRPPGLPNPVVYPFGGGDLLSALTTYPDSTLIETISLELAGDPRRITTLKPRALDDSLALIRSTIGGLLSQNDSTSESLMKTQQGDIPGELAFFLVALAVYDLEPVSLRYFKVGRDGSLAYLSKEQITAVEKKTARRRKGSWTPPDFSEAFANSELGFRPKGAPPGSPLFVHRHIGANLGDDALGRDASILRHLESLGRVSAMTKAASYCLWNPNFTKIRDYLLAHMEYMVSDSTGIPPRFAKKAGFGLETYGTFAGSFLDASPEYNDEFRKLWASQPRRKLPFRYGYLDSAHAYHLVIMRRIPAAS